MSHFAAEQLLAEHAPALRNFLGARCRDDDLTAEMLQEVAARLVTATARLALNGNTRGYLFRIAANVWRDHLRRELVRRLGALAAAAAVAGLLFTRAPSSDAARRGWNPTKVWSATAGYVAGGNAMVDIDAQLTRLEQERSYGVPN